jgi:hypothetical protein
MAYAVSQRTHGIEFMALGANRLRVADDCEAGMTLALLGVALGLASAYV